MWIFGSRNNDLSSRYELIWINSSSELRFYYGEKNYTFNGVGLGSIDFDISANFATVNGVSVFPTPYTGFEKSLYIFSCNSDVPQNETIKQLLFSMKIYENNKLVRDFVPCKSPSGISGLYDLSSNEFKGSDGPNQFIAGPEIYPKPIPNPLDPYTWYEEDNPTITQLQQYLSNISAIRSVFENVQNVPENTTNAKKMSVEMANNIEKILEWVENTISIMRQTFVACGPATCGGYYL